MSTSGAVKPSCWKEKGSNAKPSNTDACITKLKQPKIKPDAPDSLLNYVASCPKISDDGQFKSLGDAWADTTTAHGRLMLTVLGGLAEFERELIRVRTGEGRVRAKARGVHMGRPFKLNRHQQREAIARREAGEALTDIARTFGVHHTTIGRLRA